MNARLFNLFAIPVMKISGVITENERVKLINKFESIKSTNHGALDGDATSTHNSLRNINDYLGDEILSRLKIRANDFALTLALRPLDICNTWINIQNKDSVLKFHTHPNSEVSGALYLNVGDDAGSITFMNPNPYVKYQHYETENDYNAKSFWIKPNNGDLILFPSWLEHGSFDNKMDGRMCISFNTLPLDYLETT